MYAIAFDLVIAETKKHHPKGDPSVAHREISKTPLALLGVREAGVTG